MLQPVRFTRKDLYTCTLHHRAGASKLVWTLDTDALACERYTECANVRNEPFVTVSRHLGVQLAKTHKRERPLCYTVCVEIPKQKE